MKEFEIINKFFKKKTSSKTSNKDVLINIGDDCALIDINNYRNLLITSDVLISGTHFLLDTPADAIGYKSLAVSISDIAAMGGIPKWAVLNITLNQKYVNNDFINNFTKGFFELAEKYNIELIGGDTSSCIDDIISVAVTLMGTKSDLNNHKILTRAGAKINDGIFITGDLGAPSFILDFILNNNNKNNIKIDFLDKNINKLYYPKARVNTGLFISQYATSCIDISDGLLADLSHILNSSNKSACLYLDNLPINDILNQYSNKRFDNTEGAKNIESFYNYILTGGDEYELLFTAPIKYKNLLENYNNTKITYIGSIVNNMSSNNRSKIFLLDQNGNINNNLTNKYNSSNNLGWEHFS